MLRLLLWLSVCPLVVRGAAQAVQPGCFEACASCNLHARGQWVARSSEPPYQLNHSLWSKMGLTPVARTAPHHYGRCDDLSLARGRTRQLYDWVPDNCELKPVERESACAVLSGKQLMIAGDSTAGQLFLSLVLLLGGRFGRNSRRTSAISDIPASVCDGRTRLIFVRNDLLLWTDHRSEYNRARACDPLLKADAFMQRAARDADILVLQAGHHFPASMEATATSGQQGLERVRRAFFTRALNQAPTAVARRARALAPPVTRVCRCTPWPMRVGHRTTSHRNAPSSLPSHSA